jgi:aminoglycoside phosphotransferase (APT) family kinase protein
MFGRRDDQPRAVVKTARLAGFNERTRNEFAVLQELHACLPRDVARSVPQPIASGVLDGGTVLIETPAAGHNLTVSCERWGVRSNRKVDDLRAAIAWLIAFQQSTRKSTAAWDEYAARRWLEAPIAEYRRRFGVTPAEQVLWDDLRRRSADCYGLTLPYVWQHGDFHAWNVFRGPAGTAVIDWESARCGLPLTDLAYFVVWWYQAVKRLDGPAKEVGFARLLQPGAAPDREAAAVRQEWARYLSALEVDRRFVPVLHAVTWISHALDEADRFAATRSPDADPRSGNVYCRYIEALAKLGTMSPGGA